MIDENEILDAVKRRNPPGTGVRISRTIPGFLDGELVVVEISRDEQSLGENFYYAARYRSEARSFASMDELALWIGQRQSEMSKTSKFNFLADFRIVSALIAIVITLTICTIILTGLFGKFGVQIPDILGNALTTILGFYFGSQVAKTRTHDIEKVKVSAP